MLGQLLRRHKGLHDWEPVRRATWTELFFDLVFVVAVSRLGVQLSRHPSGEGLLVFFGLLATIWWLWISYSYFADLFDDDGPMMRVAQLTAMLGAAVLAVLIGTGAGQHSGGFAATYTALLALLGALYALVGRVVPEATELCRWYLAGSLLGAAGWGASLLVAPPGRYAVWAAALVVNAMVSGPLAYARMTEPPQQRSHMPERFGLFTIVVLGEAVLGAVNGLAVAAAHGPAVVTTVVSGFVIACCVWWVYFEGFDESAIDRAIAAGRGAQVRSFLYGYGHMLVYGAIVVAGVSVELAAKEVSGARHVPAAALLGGAQAVLIAGLLLVEQGIGLRVTPAVLGARGAMLVLSLCLAFFASPLVTAMVGAGGWMLLVGVEIAASRRAGLPVSAPAAGGSVSVTENS